MKFQEALDFTRTVGSPTSYEEEELRALWYALSMVPARGTVLEIGCEFGRSTSLILQAAREREFKVIVVDPFVTDGDPLGYFLEMTKLLDVHYELHVCRTQDAVETDMLPDKLDMVHIDGDHEEAGLDYDCQHLLPRVVPWGIAVFHDYGRESLPTVKEVVHRHTSNWIVMAQIGTCLVLKKEAMLTEMEGK